MSGAPARRAAAELLMLCLDSRRTLDEAMVTSETFMALEGADRRFARAMASGALRELGRIDAGLAPLSNRPIEKLSPAIRALARIGLVQLWRLKTEPHAAVNATVDAAKGWPDATMGGGFLNAVLRRASREPFDLDTVSPLKVWPDWLQARFVAGLGHDAAMALARAQLKMPGLHLTAKTDVAAVAAAVGGEVLHGHSVRAPSGVVEDMPGYEDGAWWVQDAGAALPAAILDIGSGETVIDLCAAPGGKTMQLASAGGSVLAVDRSKARLQRLSENVQRTGLQEYVTVIAEKAETWRPSEPVTKLLLDAPCSALGTLRRHPEGAWIKKEADIQRFPAVQMRLLTAAADMMSPGGTLVYCVCTPLPEEGVDVIDAAIEAGLYRRRAVLPDEVSGFEASITPKGDLLTVPMGGADHDAFFISRLVRT